MSPCDPSPAPSLRGRPAPVLRPAYKSDRTLIVFGRVRARITVDYETVLLRDYTWEFADSRPPSPGHPAHGSAHEKCSVAVKNEQSSLREEGFQRCPCYPYPGCLSASVQNERS
jgi:hypothetical protein